MAQSSLRNLLTLEFLAKVLIWTFVLIIGYVLEHFFFVIFLTFVLSYSMRTIVLVIEHKVFKKKKISRIVETSIVLACFLILLWGLYGICSYLGPKLLEQGQSLVKKFNSQDSSGPAMVEEVLASTVGTYLFKQKFGDTTSTTYIEAFNSFNDPYRALYEWDRTYNLIMDAFESSLSRDESIGEFLSMRLSPAMETKFNIWVLNNKAQLALDRDVSQTTLEWEKLYKAQEFKVPGLTPFSNLSEAERQSGILHYMTVKLLSNDQIRSSLLTEWRKQRSKSQFESLSTDEKKKRFSEFYIDYKSIHPSIARYDLPIFRSLEEARLVSQQAFLKVLSDTYPKAQNTENVEPSLERARRAFEKTQRLNLTSEWRNTTLAKRLEKVLGDYLLEGISQVGKFVGELIPTLILLPFQLGLALLLSFLICIDIPRLKRGLNQLEQSRIKEIYKEVVPGISNFGKLIGRTFEAQGLIAIVNSLLTLVAIELLGIQNALFLCSVVFLCSFIPVLGVVFSSIPIAIMALIQEDGGLLLALSSIGAILLVHFIETSLLNPKILGDMLHLHPVLVLTILAISEHFFGIWGLLLGVPVSVYIIRFVILQQGIPGLIEIEKK
jgi:predicted PurR-regulated permease PerM